jgi:hypothetical protein
MADRELTYSDILRAAEERDPQLCDMVVAYLQQPDPAENAPEEPPETEEGAELSEPPPLPEGTWTMDRLRSTLSQYNLGYKSASERKAIRAEAWDGILGAPHPPPRLRLGQLLLSLYEEGDERARAALMEIFRRAPVGWGMWQGLKRIYKLAEERHDAPMFGVLAWRLDAMGQSPYNQGEVSPGTFVYMRRRAWRYLRQLGQAVPEVYPQFAAEVLRNYPRGASFGSSWVASQIWAHEDLKYCDSAYFGGPPKDLKKRAFDEAWKANAEPLLRLLEDAQCDQVCDFAIRSLQRDFPAALREVDARWLARIGKKPLASVHDFIVKVLSDSPEFHQSKLKGLGLHEMVLALLRSESASARKYAVEYARAHAPDIDVEELVGLVADGAKEVRKFAAARLEQKSPAEIGLPALVRLLGVSDTEKLAEEKIRHGFKPGDLDAELYIVLATGAKAQSKFLESWFKDAKLKIPARFYCVLLDDPRGGGYYVRRQALAALGKRPGEEVGLDWIKKALLDSDLSGTVGSWLRGGMFKGEALDVEWLKGLVMRPSLRGLALEVLGNPKLVAPARLGLGWLLALARQADETQSRFAHNYLLEHFAPEDFAREAGAGLEAGVDRLWSLASGAGEPESVRSFAATYLKVHHPELGPTMSEARSLGIKPRLKRDAYGLARVRPLFFDSRADVRRLAAAIGRLELVHWGERSLPFDLADSSHREARALAAEVLLAVGQPDADPKVVPPEDWLFAARVFALAESPVKATREIALTLIRRHYQRLGGARRLAWLMESPDREVRLFAVRLLWEKHRPREFPEAWKPAKRLQSGGAGGGSGQREAEPPTGTDRFESTDALRQFLRTIMFGLPPGRMERRELGPGARGALPDRPLPASVAKKRLVEVVRDMSVEQEGFARVALPVLQEFSHSQAKGEWQSCVAALARIRKTHPALPVELSDNTNATA